MDWLYTIQGYSLTSVLSLFFLISLCFTNSIIFPQMYLQKCTCPVVVRQCSLEVHLVNSIFQILYLLTDFYQWILSILEQVAEVAVGCAFVFHVQSQSLCFMLSQVI